MGGDERTKLVLLGEGSGSVSYRGEKQLLTARGAGPGALGGDGCTKLGVYYRPTFIKSRS